jgi:hypothetical protein
MKKTLFSALLVIGLLLISSPMTIFAENQTIPEDFLPIDINADKYIEFGDSKHNRYADNGIKLDVDIESIATWWVNLGFQIDPETIKKERIGKFYVLANGKIVDTVFIQYQDADGNGVPDPVSYYTVKPEDLAFAGGYVNFQIVGVRISNADWNIEGKLFGTEFAVAWSAPSDTIHMDPVKVNDSEAIGVLQAILAKLDEIEKMLASKLNNITEELQTMFTPTPEAQNRLDNSMSNLMKKMPMNDMVEQSEEIKKMFEDTQLDRPMEKITFGDKRDWLGIGTEFYLLDLTEMKEQIELLRKILAAVIWIEFFFWLIFYLSPRLNI